MIAYFTKQEAIQANKVATSTYSQPHVVQQEANLDYIIARLETYAEDSKNEEEKLLRKAAYLLRYLAYQGHIFADGNKRTAFTLTKSFLELNGFSIPVGSDEEEIARAKLMKEIAEGRYTVSHLFKWLKTNTAKI